MLTVSKGKIEIVSLKDTKCFRLLQAAEMA